jgi:hypothetical protein
VFTEDGYFLRAWNYTVDTPHGMFASSTSHEQSVWITDVGSGRCSNYVLNYLARNHIFAHALACMFQNQELPNLITISLFTNSLVSKNLYIVLLQNQEIKQGGYNQCDLSLTLVKGSFFFKSVTFLKLDKSTPLCEVK